MVIKEKHKNIAQLNKVHMYSKLFNNNFNIVSFNQIVSNFASQIFVESILLTSFIII